MNRFLVRRCSMSSIEEEDESATSDELITQVEKLSSPSSFSQQSSPSVLEWDSELSESEQEYDENNKNNSEELAANRALQNFIQSCSRTHESSINEKNGCNSPFAIHLYDEEDSTELDILTSELRDFKNEFDKKSNVLLSSSSRSVSKLNPIEKKFAMNSSSSKSSSLLSPNNCVSELRTLEDQLEAALASLTLTINDCSIGNLNSPQQQCSSDSSACSSGLGEEIGTESSYHLYNVSTSTHQTNSYISKLTTTTDDCDSAYSDSGSNEKNSDESLIYRSIINPIEEPSLNLLDPDDCLLSQSQHPSKILVRTYNDDGSTKSIFIDDAMFIRDILFVLIHKNHREPDMNYALIEILPDLHMERIFEDHQKLTEAILMWPTVSSNRLSFTKRSEKYNFLRSFDTSDQLFQSSDIEGNIYLKEKSRKSWKKYFCVLRSSGLYFVPKGKSKKDLVCLAKFENVELFVGFDWKKKFKSPSDFCFALKHPLIQKKSSKYIKYMCVENKDEFDRWIRNIRIAKFGQQLKINYLFMEKAMNTYRSSGRFVECSQISIDHQSHDDLSINDRQTPIQHNQYYTINSITSSNNDDHEHSPIKSASYMDELRQRLERVLNDPPPPPSISSPKPKEPHSRATLIPPPKFKSVNTSYFKSNEHFDTIKPSMTIGSTPLPRKQIQTVGNLSYRTINTINRHPQQQQMSQSFIVSSKTEDHRILNTLLSNSKSDSLHFDQTDSSPPTSIFLNNLTKQPLISSKEPPSTPIVSKSIRTSTFNSNQRQVPPVPPRKSSMPRSSIKPPLPERKSSTNLPNRKPTISYL